MNKCPVQAKLLQFLATILLRLSVISIFSTPDSLKMVFKAKINVSELMSGIGLSYRKNE